MSELISGKEALIALGNGQEVQHYNKKIATFGNLVRDEEWGCCDELTISDFNSDIWAFRLKPRTITINSIEVPAPFEPKEGERFYYFSDEYTTGYASAERSGFYGDMRLGVWRTEEEIKQVIAALRSIFK